MYLCYFYLVANAFYSNDKITSLYYFVVWLILDNVLGIRISLLYCFPTLSIVSQSNPKCNSYSRKLKYLFIPKIEG